MVLLKLMNKSLFGDSQRKMFFKCHVVYVDESLIYGWDAETRLSNLKIVTDFCDSVNFEYTIIPLERVYDEEFKEDFSQIKNQIL